MTTTAREAFEKWLGISGVQIRTDDVLTEAAWQAFQQGIVFTTVLLLSKLPMPWRPIQQLMEWQPCPQCLEPTDCGSWQECEKGRPHPRYGDETGFLLLAPELVDEDCNVHGVGMGYFQDGPWEDEAGRKLPDEGGWLACKWSMSNDEWYQVPCNPTHYCRLTGAAT